MIKKLSILLVITVIAAALAGCAQFFYQPPMAKFNHEKHVDTLFKQQKDCFFCHKLPDIETMIKMGGELKITPELKVENQCHTCHRDEPTKIAAAPQNCNTCHDNMKAMKPADHVNNWINMHAVPASLDSKKCSTCHQDWYCESCHSRQFSYENFRHSRSFKLKHSMEAMIDPGSCDSCHKVDFCIDCHRKD